MKHKVALTMIKGIGNVLARGLLQAIGTPEAIFAEKPSALIKIPGISHKLVSEIKKPEVLLRAEKECLFIEKNNIQTFFISDANYPHRLRNTPDAPTLLYYKGQANLNSKHIISIIGTRNATAYGREAIEDLLQELSKQLPEALIISGLAYGIDIHAHRQALQNKLPTVGVLAHGLDRIYPSVHRATAVEMLAQGGLLTDYPTGTKPDKANFIQRNRIVAGLSDATVVVESAAKGGSLITADIAFSYDRNVLAFPGRAKDEASKGCNKLIRQNKASLITSTADLMETLNWKAANMPPQATQGNLPFEDTPSVHPLPNNPLLRLLHQQKQLHVNELSIALNIPISELTPMLFELEITGRIKSLPGNVYELNK